MGLGLFAYPIHANQPSKREAQAELASLSIPIEHVPGEVLVKFKNDATDSEKKRIHDEFDVDVLSVIPKLKIERVKSRRGESTEQLLARYRQSPRVEYAEPNGIVHTMLVPNDPRFSELWGLHNTGQSILGVAGTPDADIDAPEAWDIQTGSNSVIVADVDTGVDYNHPDLAANIWTNPGEIPGNGIDDDGNGYIDDVHGWDFVNHDNDPMDDYGHGTHTAGTIAAVGNNGIGVVGVSWRAKIMPLKFLDSTGTGYLSDAALAITYAADMGAKVSSNSWGCASCFSQTLEDAIAYANTKGMLFVVAAGNNSSNNDTTITYPCISTQPNVICVAATDYNDQKAGFSNYGASSVDLGAPGVSILSTVPTGSCTLCDPSGYRLLNGTSMATPHVSGAAALLIDQFPGLAADEVKNLIMGSVTPIPALSGITVTGGRLNSNDAIRSNYLVNGTPSSQAILGGQGIAYTVNVKSLNNVNAPVTLSVISPNSNITGNFSVNPVTPPANGSSASILSISTSADTPAGDYKLTIQGVNNLGESHSAAVTLQVGGFKLSMNPTSRTVSPGGSTSTYAVNLTSISGYSGSVTLSFAATDPDISGAFNVNPVTLSANGSVTTNLTVTKTSSVPLGNYVLTIGATDGIRSSSALATLVVTQWDLMTYDGPASSLDNARRVAIDSSGNIYVTGSSRNVNGNPDFATVKYGPDGHELWVARYDNGGQEEATALAIDAAGNVYVTGYSLNGAFDYDYATVKYDSVGNQLWVARFDGGSYDYAMDLSIDTTGNVYVTGYSGGALTDYVTIKYDSAGQQRWVARYDGGPVDDARRVVVDGDGNVYVTGFSWGPTGVSDFATVKYGPDGHELWVARYDNGNRDEAAGLAVDAAGNVFVTGMSINKSGNSDYATVKYDSAGNQVWATRYDSGGNDNPAAIQTDISGNIYVTGGSSGDYATVKYDPSGQQLWAARYNNGGPDNAVDLSVDPSGNVYVTGSSSDDYATVIYDAAGNQKWVARYDSGGKDTATDLAVDPSGNVYVTGSICQTDSSGNCISSDYGTIKYPTPPISHAPVLNPIGSKSVNEGSLLSFTVSGSDPDGDPITYSAAPLPVGASFDPATRLFSWTPGAGQAGTYIVTFTVSDGNLSASEAVSITVLGVADLSLSMTESADPILLNETVTYTVTVTNNGPDPATGVTLQETPPNSLQVIVNISQGQCNVGANPWTPFTCSLGTVGVGASATVTLIVTGSFQGTMTNSAGVTAVEADPSPANNTATAMTTVNPLPSSFPDLIISAVSTATTAIAPGKTFVLSNTVKNQGGSKAGAFTIAFHLSVDAAYGGSDDIPFTQTRSLTALGIGVSGTASTTLTVPPATPLGTYHVCAMADSGNTVAEGNENNNTLCTSATIQVTRADLVMTAVTPGAATVNQGAYLSVTDTVQNQGLVSTGVGFRISYHLSVNTTYGDADDVVITTYRSVAALAAGASNTATTSLLIPSTTPPNRYYVCAWADSLSAVAETNELNNTRCSNGAAIPQVTVPPPDLVMTAVSTTTTAVAPGKTLSLSNTVANQSPPAGSKAGAFVIAFHLSTNTTYGDGDDIAFTTTRSVTSLAIGATNTASTTLTVSTGTPLGPYYVCALADSGNTVNEGAYEGNNSLCTATPIQVTRPDLIMTQVSPNAATAAKGATLSVTDTVQNQEGVATGTNIRIAYHLSLNTIYGDSDDVVISTTRTVSSLAVGASNTATTSLTIPTSTPSGIYYVCAKADSLNTVIELDEGNNTLCSDGAPIPQVTVP